MILAVRAAIIIRWVVAAICETVMAITDIATTRSSASSTAPATRTSSIGYTSCIGVGISDSWSFKGHVFATRTTATDAICTIIVHTYVMVMILGVVRSIAAAAVIVTTVGNDDVVILVAVLVSGHWAPTGIVTVNRAVITGAAVI